MKRSSAQIFGCVVCLALGLLFGWGIVVFGLANWVIVYLALTMLPVALAAYMAGRKWKAASIVGVAVFFAPALLLGLLTDAKIEGLGMPFVIAMLCVVVIGVAAIGILMRKQSPSDGSQSP